MTDPARLEQIDAIIAEVTRVWNRNPGKSLAQLMLRVAAPAGCFDPADIGDDQLLAELRRVGNGAPAAARTAGSGVPA